MRLERGFIYIIGRLMIEEVVFIYLFCDRCQKELRVVFNLRIGLVGQLNFLKDRQMWIEKLRVFLVIGLGYKVIYFERYVCVWQGIFLRKGMFVGSFKVGIDGFKQWFYSFFFSCFFILYQKNIIYRKGVLKIIILQKNDYYLCMYFLF